MEYPEPLATIARMRGEGCRDAEIAAHIGMDRGVMQQRVAYWNRKHPNAPMPRATPGRVSTLPVEAILRDYRNGDPLGDIAQRHGITKGSVASVILRMRERADLPRRYCVGPVMPSALHTRLRNEGACPPLGTMSGLINRLGADTFDKLLKRLDRTDAYLADAIARIVKEALDDPKG